MLGGCISSGRRGRSGYAQRVRVSVLYFGVLKELLGADRETVEIAEGANVSALYHHLQERTSNRIEAWPSRIESWPPLAVAVNREYADLAAVLHEGDEVALLPPVSGG